MRHSFILVLTILFFISCTPPTPEPVNKKTVDLGTDDNATEQPKFYTIIKIIDGDTIKIDFEGKPVNVRYIGIDTPETVHPGKPVEPY